jgi:hypothetical protein
MTFNAFYYGLLAVGIAEICTEEMAAKIGYDAKEGISSRCLDKDVCASCGNLLQDNAGEQVIVENTHRLACSHEFCIRGWCIVVEKHTCPYCHEKVDLQRIFTAPWAKLNLFYQALQYGICSSYCIVLGIFIINRTPAISRQLFLAWFPRQFFVEKFPSFLYKNFDRFVENFRPFLMIEISKLNNLFVTHENGK